MDDGRSGGGAWLRIGAIAAAAGLGMFAAYLLGIAGGNLIMLVLPFALALFVIGTLAVLQPQAARQTQDDSGRERFDLELERSRRHERPLGLLRITVSPIPGDGRSASVDAAHVVDVVRVVDAVWVEGHHVFVLMPETDRVALARALGRIVARLPGIGTDAMRVAVYPDDGLTSGALFARLEADDAEPRPADIVHLTPATRDEDSARKLG